MITELYWVQHVKTIDARDLDAMTFINPRPHFYIITLRGWHLCHVKTNGADETGDIDTAMTLCRLHYQHSFSEDT